MISHRRIGMNPQMILEGTIHIGYYKEETSAVRIALNHLRNDLQIITDTKVRLVALSAEESTDGMDILAATKNVRPLSPCASSPGEAEILDTWEGYVIKECGGTLYINGADPRGTIYGIYEMSAYFGVSPWYFFADVPVKKKARISRAFFFTFFVKHYLRDTPPGSIIPYVVFFRKNEVLLPISGRFVAFWDAVRRWRTAVEGCCPAATCMKGKRAFSALPRPGRRDTVEKWARTLRCPVIRADGTRPVEENIGLILPAIVKDPGQRAAEGAGPSSGCHQR